MTEATYRAVICDALAGLEGLRLTRLSRSPLAPGTVRVALRAAGINFPDVLMTLGRYQHKPALPFVPGMEAAGVIAEIAEDVGGGLSVGQHVIVRLRTGGFAEEAVVSPGQIEPLPSGFSFAEGAAFLVAHTTAYHALATRAQLALGESVLVLGAAGGVGLAAVQTAKALGGHVIAACSCEPKLRVALAQGADAGIDYAREQIEDAVRRLTAGKGVDIVLDPVGVDQASALRCLGWGGRLLIAGFAGGAIPAYEANRILLRGASVIGVRAGEAGRNQPALRRAESEALARLAAQGLVKPHVSVCLPLERAVEAMRLLADRQAVGRVVLTSQ